jgi:hypothetical protein
MKKVLSIIAIVLLVSFTVKSFKVEGSVEDWNNVLLVIDQSDAPAKNRNAARELIMGQVQRQLNDTTIKK